MTATSAPSSTRCPSSSARPLTVPSLKPVSSPTSTGKDDDGNDSDDESNDQCTGRDDDDSDDEDEDDEDKGKDKNGKGKKEKGKHPIINLTYYVDDR